MKPSKIYQIMNLARTAREQGNVWNPLFSGPPGLGKSEIVQAWCRENNLPFIDLRAAYLEAPDMIGFPSVSEKGGRQVTTHNIPEFWPHEGEGVIFLEEVNRGTTSIMNTFMQLLTDRKVHTYKLPPKWIIAAAINPESEENDVNTMDAALKDRFEIFHIEYDRRDFEKFIKEREWDMALRGFVTTGTWTYSSPEDISKADGSKYISPRTLSKLNTALKASEVTAAKEWNAIEKEVYESILGKNMGIAFYHFKHNEQPVSYAELRELDTRKGAMQKLKLFSDPKNYKSGHISLTISSIVEDGTIANDLLAEVVMTLPADQGPVLIRELEFKRGDKANTLLTSICGNYPDVKKYLKSVLRS